jgi:hypothetical protein
MSGDVNRDSAILGALLREITGKCQVCGCEGDSCNIGGGEKCAWLDKLKTLCNNPRCIQVAEIRKRQFERDKKHNRVKRTKGRAA